MDGIQDMVFVVNVINENVFTYAYLNNAAKKGTGLREEVIGRSFQNVYDAKFATRITKTV